MCGGGRWSSWSSMRGSTAAGLGGWSRACPGELILLALLASDSVALMVLGTGPRSNHRARSSPATRPLGKHSVCAAAGLIWPK